MIIAALIAYRTRQIKEELEELNRRGNDYTLVDSLLAWMEIQREKKLDKDLEKD
jgi:hypothetical protein